MSKNGRQKQAVTQQSSGLKFSVKQDELSQLFQHNPLPMWVYDVETLAFLAVNDAAIRKYGYSEAEFLGMTIKDIRPPHEVPGLLTFLEKPRPASGNTGEWAHRTKEGRIFNVLIMSHQISYAKRLAILVVVHDISQQKNNELAIKMQEEQLQRQAELVENISDAIISTDLDFHILTWNKAAERIYGWTTEEVIGQNWTSLCRTESVDIDQEKAAEVLFLTGKWDGEVKQKRKDGQDIYIQAHVSVIRDKYGQQIGIVGVNRDITKGKNIENALKESEERFRVTFEQSAVGVSQLTPDGIYLNVNQKYCELVGYSEKELIGHHYQEITHPTDVNINIEKNNALIKGDLKSYSLEKRFVRKDGVIVWVNLSVGIVRDEEGHPKYLVGVSEDISERKTRERELDALYQGGTSLRQVSDPKAIAHKVIELLERHMEWHHAAVWIRHENSDNIEQLAYSQMGYDQVTIKDEQARSQAMVRTIHTGLAGWVIGHGVTVCNGDVKNDPRYAPVNELICSGLYVPLKIGKDTIGCISAESTAPNAFSAYNERLLTTLATQAAVALENARLYQSARRSAQRRDILNRAGREIAQASQNLEKVYKTIHRAAKKLMLCDTFTIARLDSEQKEIRGVYSFVDGKRLPEVLIPLGEGLSGKVIVSGKPLLISDYSQRNELNFIKISNEKASRSILAVPIRVAGQVIGMISAQSYQPNQYDEDDKALLEMLASNAGAAIQNADLFEQTHRRAQELEALVETSKVLSSTLEMQPLLENILLAASQAIPAAEKGMIILMDEVDRLLHIRAAHGYQDSGVINLIIQQDRGYASRIIRLNQAAILSDVYSDREFKYAAKTGELRLVKSAICVPLTVKGKAIGAISLENANKKSAFTAKDLNLLSAFASSAAVTIENARLLDQARRRVDELGALSKVSTALRTVLTRAEIIDVITEQISQVFSSEDIAFLRLDERANENVLERGLGLWEQSVGERYPLNTGISGLVSSTGQVYSSDNVLDDPRLSPPKLFTEPEALIGAPLITQNRVIGSLWAGRRQDETKSKSFSALEVRLLTSIADIASNALHRVSLYEQTAQHANQMASISMLGRTLAVTENLDEMYHTLAIAIYDLLPDIAGVFIALFDKKKAIITCACGHVDGEFIDHTQLPPIPLAPPGKGRQSEVIHTYRPLIVDDMNSRLHPTVPDVYVGDPDHKTKSALYVPMIANNNVIGIVQARSTTLAGFTEADAQILFLAANTASVEIQNARSFDDTRRRAAQLIRINDLGRALAETFNIDEIHERLAHIALDLIPGSAAVTISLFDSPKQEIRVAYAIHDGKVLDVSTLSPKALSPVGRGTQSEAIHTGKPVIIDDLEMFYRKRKMKVTQPGSLLPGAQSGIYIPMAAHGRIIGALQLRSYQKANYTPADAELLSLVANTAAVSLENTRLYDETRKNAEQLSKLNIFGRELAATLNLPSIYDTAHTYIHQFLDCSNFGIYLFDPLQQTITPVFLMVGEQKIDPTSQLPMRYDRTQAEESRAKAISTALPVIVNDLADIAQSRRESNHDDAKSAIDMPMVVDGLAIGLLEIQSTKKDAYSTEGVELLSTIANQIGLSIQNARLFAQIERQVQQLSALRTIDNAISSNTDLNTTLAIILEHVKSELRVDAADILLLKPETISLEYAAGHGFYSDAIQHTSLRLGEGIAGKTAVERKPVFINNLAEFDGKFSRASLLAGEHFAAYGNAPLVSKGQIKGILEIFHRSPLNIDREWLTFLEMMANEAAISIDNADLFNELQRSNRDLTIAYDATIEGWAQALELRDAETEGHSRRVTEMTMRLARQMGFEGQDLIHIRRGSLLHDIGKMGVPDHILRKPGPLNEVEWEIMRQHPGLAYNLLSQIPYLRPALDIPYSHHERWDGNGYPRKLHGAQIPLAARAFAVVDVYDALTTDRPYRKAISAKDAMDYIHQHTNAHFDPKVAQTFLKMMGADFLARGL